MALPRQSLVEEAVRLALTRLHCQPQIGINIGHLRVPLALPQLRLVLECSGPLGELRDIGGAAVVAEAGPLRPLLELRHAQLRNRGWHVEVLRDSEWPVASLPGDSEADRHRREELLLRRKLAGVLQVAVPQRRRKLLHSNRAGI